MVLTESLAFTVVNDSQQRKNKPMKVMMFFNRWWLSAIIQGNPRWMGGDDA
jgi:hypothetical protein